MLQPKRTKYRKQQKGRIKGLARRGSSISFGSFGLKTTITKKPLEVRMGKGKGAVDHYVASVKPGRVLFELDGVPEDVAVEALRLAAQKLPVLTKTVVRPDLRQ